ncbi:hypothetical protein ACS2U0_09665 [Bacillus cereus group sp. BC251]|uniref:hypothetical protein n=1 Tax=Bacillus TaxID=1386 RepID=UPI000C32A5BD|nr:MULTISPECIES: hypothetical protein [Bacillus cereus group]AUD21124.1 hypothetical protein CU648_00835 [Bacillus sp. HBCD-sjtu]KAA2393416.1 hypothetical protein F2Y18_18935 [Bacillus cereus]MDA1808526.1 hypothetical protein [Bacillus cereus]MEB9505127.1 hypothetical protein [Bacillus anthracis]HDR4389164.1 hypothetical protein [Bacillus cereus]
MSKKEKKPSEEMLAKQAIAKLYTSSPIIVTCKDGYAAIDKEHIQLFKFISKTKEISSIAIYELKEFETVSIDHYLIKAIMLFKGIHKTFEFIPTEQTKDIEKLLQINTSIQIVKIERKWFNKVLGYRSQTKWKMIFASAIYLFFIFTAISGFSEKKTKENATVKQSKTTSEQKKTITNTEKPKENVLKMDYGRNVNMLIYEKYGVKYQSYEPTDIASSKDKAVLEHFEKMAQKHNMSVPEYIEKEDEIVAANVQTEKEAEHNNEQAKADITIDTSQSKQYILNTLNQLNDDINTWKSMSAGNLTPTDVTVIKNDLKLVLEHVQDLQDEIGPTPQIEQFKRAVNAHINAFEVGSVKGVSKLILQANNL